MSAANSTRQGPGRRWKTGNKNSVGEGFSPPLRIALYFLLKQPVLITVPIELAVAAAEEAGGGGTLGVEADKLKAVPSDVDDEGNVVRLGHLMGDFHVQLMLDFGDGGGVGVVGCFCLQRGQSDAAAADARRAGSGQDVAANRTDVEAAAQQVGGTVRVGDDLAGEQLRQ